MLIRFRVDNYRSFGTEQSLDLAAGQVRAHPDHIVDLGDARVLTDAMVFGANASGKSNLVRAMEDSRLFIISGRPIPTNQHCRTVKGSEERNTAFEYTFHTGGVAYSYGFEVDLRTGRVIEEWLNILKPSGIASVFQRHGDHMEPGKELHKEDKATFEVYSREVAGTGGLLLSALSRARYGDDSPLNPVPEVYGWFRDRLVILRPTSIRNSDAAKEMEFLGKVMEAFDTGVSGVGFEKVRNDVVKVDGNLWKTDPNATVSLRSPDDLFRITYDSSGPVVERVVFRHGDASFSFGEESDGTKRLYDLAPLLDHSGSEDTTFVVDELDHSMHPQLTLRFVECFNHIARRLHRQLIATTHESRLFDLNVLRRDEIWMVEMRSDRTSELYSLEDFNERGDRRVDNAYLDGRYGGIPNFRDIFPDLVIGR